MAGWKTKSLGEVLLRTQTFNPALAPDDEFDYIDVSSVSNLTFKVESTQRLLGKDAPSRARRRVRAGDVLLATIRPTLKRIAIVPVELDGQVCSTGYFVLRAGSEIDPTFLFYLLFTSRFMDAMEALQKGASYPAVTDAEVRAQPVNYPPTAEQQRIVAILDEAFAGIATANANAEKNLRNCREWAERQLATVLDEASKTEEARTLDSLVAPSCSLSYGIVQPGDEVATGLPVVRPVDLGSKIVRVDGLKRIDPALARSYARTTLEGGDLLLCVRGTTGKVAVAALALAGANVTRGIVPIRFDPKFISQALGYYLLRSAPFQIQIRAKTYGTALMQINIGDLRKIVVRIPPISHQATVVAQLNAVQEAADQLADIYERKLAALDELKKSLLHQAFTGALAGSASGGAE